MGQIIASNRGTVEETQSTTPTTPNSTADMEQTGSKELPPSPKTVSPSKVEPPVASTNTAITTTPAAATAPATAAIEHRAPGPLPVSPNRPRPSAPPALDKANAIQDAIRKLEAEEKGEIVRETKNLKNECKKMSKKGKKGKTCQCLHCTSKPPLTAVVEAAKQEPLHPTLEALINACEKRGYPVSLTYAKDFLSRRGNKLILAMKDIIYDLDNREKALEATGRVSYQREKPIAESSLYSTRDMLIRFMEDDDRQLRELDAKGWASNYGQAVKKYPKPKREEWYNLYIQEAQYRNRRAEFYKERLKDIQEGKLKQEDLEPLMANFDGLNYPENSNSRTYNKPTTSRSTAGEQPGMTGQVTAPADMENTPFHNQNAATLEDEIEAEAAEVKEQCGGYGDGNVEHNKEEYLESDYDENAEVGHDAAEVRVGSFKSRFDQLSEDIEATLTQYGYHNPFLCTNCDSGFKTSQEALHHLENSESHCTSYKNLHADHTASDPSIKNEKTSKRTRIISDFDDENPFLCERCGGLFKSTDSVCSHLSKTPSACNSYYREKIEKGFTIGAGGGLELMEDDTSSEVEQRLKRQKSNRVRAVPKSMEESFVNIMAKESLEKKRLQTILDNNSQNKPLGLRTPCPTGQEWSHMTEDGKLVPVNNETRGSRSNGKEFQQFRDKILDDDSTDPFEKHESYIQRMMEGRTKREVELHERLLALHNAFVGNELIYTDEREIDDESIEHVTDLCLLISKASWARAQIDVAGGSPALAVALYEAMEEEIRSYLEGLGQAKHVSTDRYEQQFLHFLALCYHDHKYGA